MASQDSRLQGYQRRLLELAIRTQALQFGEFTLKSGRKAPYFFNTGRICSGRELDELGLCYADWLASAPVEFDALFGPAYKGIAIAVSAGAALARVHGRDVGVTYNRKEAKEHGEGGLFVGSPLTKKMLLVDDVITDGAAKLEAAGMIRAGGGDLAGVLVALDRQERGRDSQRSSVQDVAAKLGVPVFSLVTLNDLLAWLEQQGRNQELEAVLRYRSEYGVQA
jgi:orotate phosphoribosyltransferase